MFKKSLLNIVLTVSILLPANSLAQQPATVAPPIASVKYKLGNFKNPSLQNIRYALARFSDDDKLFAVLGEKQRIGIYETASGRLLREIDYGSDATDAFSFSPDGKSILMKDRLSFSVEVWDIESGKRLHKIEGRNGVSGFKNMILDTDRRRKQKLEMNAIPVSRDGKNVLVGKDDRRYDIVDLASGTPVFQLEKLSKSSDTKDVLKLLFIPGAASSPRLFHLSSAIYNSQGDRIAFANGDSAPTLWNAETGKLLANLEPQAARVYSVSFSKNSKLLATTDIDGVTRTWDAETGASVSVIGSKGRSEIAAVWSPQGEILATFSSAEKGHLYDARSGKLLAETSGKAVRELAFSPNAEALATLAKKDKSILGQIFSASDGSLIGEIPRAVKEEQPLSLEWNATGEFLAIASAESVKLFDKRGKLLQTLEKAVYPAHFSHDGKLLLTGGRSDDGFVWQIGEN